MFNQSVLACGAYPHRTYPSLLSNLCSYDVRVSFVLILLYHFSLFIKSTSMSKKILPRVGTTGPVDSVHRRPSNVQERGEQLKPPPLTSVSLFILALVFCFCFLSAHTASCLVTRSAFYSFFIASTWVTLDPLPTLCHSSGRTHLS